MDEPENSLSFEKQQGLLRFHTLLRLSVHHCDPFPLPVVHEGAKIYDLDEEVVDVKRWYELGNVRAYYEFFKKNKREFGRKEKTVLYS